MIDDTLADLHGVELGEPVAEAFENGGTTIFSRDVTVRHGESVVIHNGKVYLVADAQLAKSDEQLEARLRLELARSGVLQYGGREWIDLDAAVAAYRGAIRMIEDRSAMAAQELYEVLAQLRVLVIKAGTPYDSRHVGEILRRLAWLGGGDR